MLDISPLLHAVSAVLFQMAVGYLFEEWGVGGAIGCMWFIAREHTQAEYRWIAKYGKGKRVNMPWWGGFDYRVWDFNSILDATVPVIACAVVYLEFGYLGTR